MAVVDGISSTPPGSLALLYTLCFLFCNAVGCIAVAWDVSGLRFYYCTQITKIGSGSGRWNIFHPVRLLCTAMLHGMCIVHCPLQYIVLRCIQDLSFALELNSLHCYAVYSAVLCTEVHSIALAWDVAQMNCACLLHFLQCKPSNVLKTIAL